VTAEEYLRWVGFELHDLPWRMRRDLLAELREHLAELPEGTNFSERLGPPMEYAAELRVAAGLERRRGLIALLRRPRPRNLVLVALALTVIGLVIGAVAWVDSYQPIAEGNTSYGPLDVVYSPTGGEYVVVHQGRPFRFGITIWNRGQYTVRVLGLGQQFGLPLSFRLLMSAPTTFKYGGMPRPFTPFRPFDLKPGEQRGLIFSGHYDQPCSQRNFEGTTGWGSIPVRFSFLWRTTAVQVPLSDDLSFVYRKGDACPTTTP